jgi:hypothetical protein
MSAEDSAPDFIDSLPPWLADAVHARHSDLNRATEARAVQARMHADLVNSRLAKLGITPRRPAAGSSGGWLTPALLVEPGWDDGDETWGAEAFWDVDAAHVALIAILPGERDLAGELTGIDDVVRVMYEGGTAKEPEPAEDTPDPIAQALNGLVAAVQLLADETARLRSA